MNLALGLVLLQGLVIMSHLGIPRAEQLPVKKAYFSFKLPAFWEENPAFRDSIQSFSDFCLPFPLQVLTFAQSWIWLLACFVFLRTAFLCHLMTSQVIFSEFLSMFVFTDHILKTADSKVTMDINAAMMLKSWNTILEPLDPSHEQSPILIQAKLSFALLFTLDSCESWLAARVFILLTSGNLWIKNVQASWKLANSSFSC